MPITPEQYVKGIDKLVSLPTACTRILELSERSDTHTMEFVEAIASDPEMAAQTLRIANSAYYGFPMRIDTLSRAISVIGTRELQDLALSYSVIKTFSNVDNEILDYKRFWQHSVLTGFLARQLATRTKVKIMHKERMFLAGLLHDIGMLAMAAKTPEIMRIIVMRANQAKEPFVDVEKLVFGLT
ncbi:MAG: HDOD domain-containing protein, partial [Gammaproteobacteria bacterium]|nr:HDOD domain-containing protein [Gammaproteobacteria bacterium]